MHRAVCRSRLRNVTTFRIEGALLSAGANINALDREGRTPLHYAFLYKPQDSARARQSKPPADFPVDPIEMISDLCVHSSLQVDAVDVYGRFVWAFHRGSMERCHFFFS